MNAGFASWWRPRIRVTDRSGRGDDGAAVDQAAALLFVDVEVIEQAAANCAQEFLRRTFWMFGQHDGAAGSLVMTAGVAQARQHVVENFAGLAAEPVGAERELHLAVEDADRQRPVDFFEIE